MATNKKEVGSLHFFTLGWAVSGDKRTTTTKIRLQGTDSDAFRWPGPFLFTPDKYHHLFSLLNEEEKVPPKEETRSMNNEHGPGRGGGE